MTIFLLLFGVALCVTWLIIRHHKNTRDQAIYDRGQAEARINRYQQEQAERLRRAQHQYVRQPRVTLPESQRTNLRNDDSPVYSGLDLASDYLTPSLPSHDISPACDSSSYGSDSGGGDCGGGDGGGGGGGD